MALTNAGVCARGIPEVAAAERYFRRALEANGAYPEALLQLADLNFATGQPLSARAFLQRYEAVAPVTSYSLALGRRVELAAGDPETAAEYTRRLLREFPGSPEARELRR